MMKFQVFNIILYFMISNCKSLINYTVHYHNIMMNKLQLQRTGKCKYIYIFKLVMNNYQLLVNIQHKLVDTKKYLYTCLIKKEKTHNC